MKDEYCSFQRIIDRYISSREIVYKRHMKKRDNQSSKHMHFVKLPNKNIRWKLNEVIMRSFNAFFKIWNKFPFYPNFVLMNKNSKIICKVWNWRSKISFAVILILDVIIVAAVFWRNEGIDNKLVITASFYKIWLHCYLVSTLQRYGRSLEKNLNNLNVFYEDIFGNSRLVVDNFFSRIIVNSIIHVILYCFYFGMEIILVTRIPGLFNWINFPPMYFCHFYEVLFQMFFLYVSLNRLVVMKNFLSLYKDENVEDINRFWSKLKSNNENFGEILGGAIIARCGHCALSILLDIYFNMLYLYRTKSLDEILASVVLGIVDISIQFFVITVFLQGSSGFKKEVSEVCSENVI